MSEGSLDPQEMDAIQAVGATSHPAGQAPDREPTRLALIADDRTADTARPILTGLATRSIRGAVRGLKSHLPGTWTLEVAGIETLDGATVKEELRGGWIAGMRAGDDAEIVVAAHGGIIDVAAARRCGSTALTTDSEKPPSAVSLRLFQPAGRSLLDSWSAAWREVFPSELVASSDLAIVSRLIESRTVVRVTLAFSGDIAGRVQIYARPDALVPRPIALAAFKANALRIASALSQVPVEIIVELGTLRMTMRELRRLERGSTFMLQGFVDSRVPVYCEGVLKAWARPVVCRGVLAVQIETVVHGQGTRS